MILASQKKKKTEMNGESKIGMRNSEKEWKRDTVDIAVCDQISHMVFENK